MTKKQIANHIIEKANQCFIDGKKSSFYDRKSDMQSQIYVYWEMYYTCFANGDCFNETCQQLKDMYDALGKEISDGYKQLFK